MKKQKCLEEKIMMYRLSALVVSLMLANSATALAQAPPGCQYTMEKPFTFTAECIGETPTINTEVEAEEVVRGVISVDMEGLACLQMDVEVKKPQGWVLNFGNSPTNDGFGGDDNAFDHDSEFEIFVPGPTPGPPGGPMQLPGFQTPGALNLYTNDLGGPPSTKIFSILNFHPGGARTWKWHFEVGHHHLCAARFSPSPPTLPMTAAVWNNFIFDIDNTASDAGYAAGGFNDTFYHIGFNQVVRPNSTRVGTGVRKIGILFQGEEEDCVCVEDLTQP